MIYTRRKLLRDAATASLVASASVAFPSLSHAVTKANPFPNGVRIFFLGTWIFCKDQELDSSGREQVLAITFDNAMGHSFPYGPWKGKPTFDRDNLPGLPDNRKHAVTVQNYTTQWTTVLEIFGHADESVYATVPKDCFPPDLSSCGIRVVSIPLPTNLYTAIYSGGTIINSGNYQMSGSKAWSAHVFEYEGDQVTLTDNNVTLSANPDPTKGDFHFHTVPLPCTCHGPQMFADLFKTAFPKIPKDVFQLQAVCPEVTVETGGHLPDSVGPDELDLADLHCPNQASVRANKKPRPRSQKGNESIYNRTTASCAGAGIGVVSA